MEGKREEEVEESADSTALPILPLAPVNRITVLSGFEVN
jgi:hypothetical protein